MKTLIKFVCCALLIFGKFLSANGAVYSTPDTAMKFSYCLIKNMGSTPFFTEEDRNAMATAAGMMAQTMRDTRGQFPLKPLSIRFITSLSDVVLNDPRRNIVRKRIYFRALEQCSLALTGYVDSEFIIGALRIMSAMENAKASMRYPNEFRGGGEIPLRFRPTPPIRSIHESQVSRAFDSSTVQPTPVQNRFVPGGFATYQTTNFQVPESLYHFSSSTGETKSNINFPISGQAASSAESSYSTYKSGNSENVKTSSAVSNSQTSETRAKSSTATLSPHPRIQFSNIPNIHEPQNHDFSEPSAVQPSPVQNPLNAGGLGVHSKTVSEVPESSFDFTSSEPNSQLPLPNERDVDSPDSDKTLESSGDSADIVISPVPSHGEMTPPLLENPQSPAIFEGLSIPQTKESMVFVIPPKDVPQSEENSPAQKELVPQTGNKPEFPSDKINSQESSGDMNPSESLPHIDSFNVSTSSALESIISDIFKNSSAFSNAFDLAMNQEDAQRLARTITVQSLSGYNSELTKEAMTAVSNAVAKVTVSSPENYASALSEALASVLKLHNIPLFYDGASISSGILTNLDTKQDFNQQISSNEEITDDLTMVESPSRFEQQPPLNFQSPVFTPEDEAGKIFSNTLSQYLAGSFKLAQIFCASNNITNNIQTYFRLIKSSMSMYGTQLSLIATITICASLMEVPTESLCSAYPRVISDIISEILYETGQLQEASPEEILKQMELSVSFLQASSIQTQQAEIDNSEKDNSSEFDEIIPTLQSSYSYEPGTPLDMPLASDSPSGDVDEISIPLPSSDDHSLIQQQHEENITETTQDSVREFSDSIPITPMEEQVQHSESPINYTILTTTPFSIQISKEAFSEAVVLIDTITTLSDLFPTDKSLSDDSTINEEELATYLLGEMKSALAALNDKPGDQEPTANTSESVAKITKDKLDDQKPTANHSESVSKTAIDDQEPTANHGENVSRTAIDNQESTANHGESVSKSAVDNQESTSSHSESVSRTAIDDQESTINHGESISKTVIDDQEPTANNSEIVSKTSIDGQEPTMIHTENVGKNAELFTDKQTENVEYETKLKTTRPRKNYHNRRGHKKHKTTTSEVDSESNSTILNFSDHDVNKTDILVQQTDLNSDRQTEEFSGSVKKDLSSSSNNKSTTISNMQRVDLQPSFQGSQFSEISSSSEILPIAIYDIELDDRLLSVAKSLSEISSSTIAFIKSENFDINELCAKLNEFASVVDIPPLNSCKKVPVIEYLMHVLLSTLHIFKDV